MKIVGLVGSPRKKSNTDLLVDKMLEGARASGQSTEKLYLYDSEISPCIDCRECKKGRFQCVVEDDMQMIYRELGETDRVVLASPIQFMGPTAQMKLMIDRCQALWARKYVLKMPPLDTDRERKGLFISVGALKKANLFEPTLTIVKSLFRVLDITYAGELVFPGMDEKGAIAKHPEALEQAFLTGQKLVTDR